MTTPQTQRTLTDCRLIELRPKCHPTIMTVWLRNDTGGWTRVQSCIHVRMYDFREAKTWDQVNAIIAKAHDF